MKIHSMNIVQSCHGLLYHLIQGMFLKHTFNFLVSFSLIYCIYICNDYHVSLNRCPSIICSFIRWKTFISSWSLWCFTERNRSIENMGTRRKITSSYGRWVWMVKCFLWWMQHASDYWSAILLFDMWQLWFVFSMSKERTWTYIRTCATTYCRLRWFKSNRTNIHNHEINLTFAVT